MHSATSGGQLPRLPRRVRLKGAYVLDTVHSVFVRCRMAIDGPAAEGQINAVLRRRFEREGGQPSPQSLARGSQLLCPMINRQSNLLPVIGKRAAYLL